ncbi:hypothetical protein [Streptomyces sp. NPDC088350]|uniref:hypothetical protein n=1 Tax=Streptomyces sp. NPDC088350 TaxID=3365854 RepID=UPI003812BAFB
MVVAELLKAVAALEIEQLMQSRYGALGFLCLFLLGAGIKARSATCASAGAVILVLLMTQA